MGLYSGRLIIRRIFASEIWGAYFQEGLFFLGGGGRGALLLEFYSIGNGLLKLLFQEWSGEKTNK